MSKANPGYSDASVRARAASSPAERASGAPDPADARDPVDPPIPTPLAGGNATAAAEAAAEKRYNTLFRDSADVMLVIDPADGWIVDANRAAEAFYGYDRDQLLSRSVVDINADPPDRTRKNMSRAVTGTQQFFHFQHRLASGEVREVEVSSSRVAIDGRTLLYSIIHDISDRIAAERAVRSSEALLDRAESIAHVGSWRLDLATGAVVLSAELARIFAIDPSRSDLRSADVMVQAIHPDDQRMVEEAKAAALRDGVLRRVDCRLLHPDGSVRWVHAEGEQELDDSGRVVALVGFVQDVTERKQAEAALRAREVQLREAQRVGRTGNWTWDVHSDAPVWSEQVYRMYGMDPGMSPTSLGGIDSLFTPESANQIRVVVGRAHEDGEPYEFEAEFVRPDGAHGWTLHRGVPVRGPDGAVASIHGTDTDITERKHAEDRLRHSEATHRTILEQSPIPIAAHRAGRAVFANEAHRRMFRYSSFADLEHLDVIDLVAPESRSAVYELVHRRSLGPPDESEYEFVGRRLDGTTFPALAKTAPIELPDGPATLVFLIDQTDARRASEALRASEEKFAKAFAAAPVLISLTDLETAVYVDVNEEALRLTGFSRDELIGRTAVGIGWISAENRARLLEELRANGRIIEMEMDFRAKEGQTVIGLVSGELISIFGRDCLLTATVDITELRRAERERVRLQAELAQSQKMEAIGRLAGGVAHDFNNLLTAIGGYARILETDLAAGSADPADAAEIRRAADRAAALTARLLAFSGRHHIQREPIDLRTSVDRILPMLRRIVPERIDIATQLLSGPPVQADPTEVDQVIVNLVVNAADATPAIGTISIETGAVDHDAAFVQGHLNSRLGPHARLTVTDTGSGMDETIRARIFEPFFTTKPVGQGTGLGLATVYGVVERLGGTIEVSSTPGVGTAFRIDLPTSGPVAGSAIEATERPAEGGTERILLVEDEPMVRQFVTAALLRLGYRVVAAECPAEARAVPCSDYDLLITDVVMPGMDGTQLVRTLRLTRPNLPVLFVSGYSQGTVSSDTLDEPRTAMLSKPFTPVELAGAARALLDGTADAEM